MPKSSFTFKQFTICHDHCAMKVGTDGVLLGAWAPADGAARILDVGTGSGLIALQLAQRNPQAQIVAVEVDPEAAGQAQQNVDRSPWKDRVEVVCCDFRTYQSAVPFDLVVSNPPYFVDALKCPDQLRSAARHTGGLNYDSLFRRSVPMLSQQGQVSIIIPAEVEKQVVDVAWTHRLYPSHLLRVYTKPGKPCRRVLLTFSRSDVPCSEESLSIQLNDNTYSPEYVALTRDFYLKM